MADEERAPKPVEAILPLAGDSSYDFVEEPINEADFYKHEVGNAALDNMEKLETPNDLSLVDKEFED